DFPTQSAHLQRFSTGHARDSVTDPASAAAAGVPYPYPGFSGLAYQAISPYPQIWSQAPANLFLVNADIAAINYKAMVAELKSNDLHGIAMEVNYTMSRIAGSATPIGSFA